MARRLTRSALFLALVFVLLCGLPGFVHAEKIYKTKYFDVIYDHTEQLEQMAEKLRPGAVTATLNRIMVSSGGQEETLGSLIDRLFKRVQMLLEMYIKKKRFIIRLYDSKQEILEAFERTGGAVSQYQNSKPPAFYAHKKKIIYLQTRELHMGMLAHEMGHAIQFAYFVIAPPLKVQEMLCQYIDKEITKEQF